MASKKSQQQQWTGSAIIHGRAVLQRLRQYTNGKGKMTTTLLFDASFYLHSMDCQTHEPFVGLLTYYPSKFDDLQEVFPDSGGSEVFNISANICLVLSIHEHSVDLCSTLVSQIIAMPKDLSQSATDALLTFVTPSQDASSPPTAVKFNHTDYHFIGDIIRVHPIAISVSTRQLIIA